MPEYYLASLKLGGWLSKTAQYTTDIKQAWTLSRDEALKLARRHKVGGGILIPVLKSDMEEI